MYEKNILLATVLGIAVILFVLFFILIKKNRDLSDTIAKNNEALNQEIESLSETLSEKGNEINRLNDSYIEIKEKLLKDREDISKLASEISDASNVFSELEEKNNETTALLQKNKEEHDYSLAEMTKIFTDEITKNQNRINALKEKVNARIDKTNSKEKSVASLLQEIVRETNELKKRVDFFSEIDSDSAKMNVSEDEETREFLIQKALQELLEDNIGANDEETLPDLVEEDYVGKIEDVPEEQPAEEAQKKESRVLDHEQSKILKALIKTNSNYFITGRAGTGKSFLLDAFTSASDKRILKLAPTGIAALNIRGATIHSAFGFYNLESLSEEEIIPENVKMKPEKRMILKKADTIVIDEISMVRSDTLEKINLIIQCVCGSKDPFGGKQMVLFGDLFQLPPIAKSQVIRYLKDNYGGIYFFNSKAFKNGSFKYSELTVNHRQESDSSFFNILNNIREGCETEQDIAALNKRVVRDKDELRRVMTVFPKKAEAEAVNRAELLNIQAKEYTYNAVIRKALSDNYTSNIEAIFPITETLKLKVGALVMMVANDPEKRWVNGTLGIIKNLKEDFIQVTIDGYTYDVSPCIFSEQEAVYENGRIEYQTKMEVEQYPIVLAYAITIHKSQGMTYQQIACDISNCFAPGQAYVALSRCTSIDGLHLLTPVTKQSLQVDSNILEFYDKQRQQLLG